MEAPAREPPRSPCAEESQAILTISPCPLLRMPRATCGDGADRPVLLRLRRRPGITAETLRPQRAYPVRVAAYSACWRRSSTRSRRRTTWSAASRDGGARWRQPIVFPPWSTRRQTPSCAGRGQWCSTARLVRGCRWSRNWGCSRRTRSAVRTPWATPAATTAGSRHSTSRWRTMTAVVQGAADRRRDPGRRLRAAARRRPACTWRCSSA